MKYLIALFYFAQIVLSAPQDKPIVEQAQELLTNAQQQATVAVTELNQKFLQSAGLKSNEELLNTVNTQAQSYATQVKDVADQINKQLEPQKETLGNLFSTLTKQLTDTATEFLNSQDPAKAESIQKTLNNVLQQTNALSTELQHQGVAAQSALSGAVGKLYEQTLQTAKSVATQIDASQKS